MIWGLLLFEKTLTSSKATLLPPLTQFFAQTHPDIAYTIRDVFAFYRTTPIIPFMIHKNPDFYHTNPTYSKSSS